TRSKRDWSSDVCSSDLTSFGGLIFMMATIALLGAVISVLWQAVYQYVRAVFLGRPVVVDAWMIGWFTVAAALCAAATVVPLWIEIGRASCRGSVVGRVG